MSQAERDTLTRQRDVLHELWPWMAMLRPDTVVYPQVDGITTGATLAELRERPGTAVYPCPMCWPAVVYGDRWGRCTCGQPLELHGLVGLAWLLDRLWALLPELDVVRAVNRRLGPCEHPRAIGLVHGFDHGHTVCRCGHRFDAHSIADLNRALANAVVALVARDGAPGESIIVGLTHLLESVTPSGELGAESTQFKHAENCAIPAGGWRQFSTRRQRRDPLIITFDPVISVEGPLRLTRLYNGSRLHADAEIEEWLPIRTLRLMSGEIGERLVVVLQNQSEVETRVLISVESDPEEGVACDSPLSRNDDTSGCVRCGVAVRNHAPLDLVAALHTLLARVGEDIPPDARADLACITEEAQLAVITASAANGSAAGFTLPAGVNPQRITGTLTNNHTEPEALLADRLAGAANLLLQRPEDADTVEAWLVDTYRLLTQAHAALGCPPELLPDNVDVRLLAGELALAFHDLLNVGHVAEARLECLRMQLARQRFSSFDRDSVRLPEFEGYAAPAAEVPVSLAPEDDAHTTHLRSPPEAHPSGGETLRELDSDDETTVDDDSASCSYELVEMP